MTTMEALTTPDIRSATAADRVAILHLLDEAKLPTAGVAERLTESPTDFFVAVDPDTDDVVAVAALQACCENALLRSVAVRPDWRARGLGRAVVERVVAEAESRGVRGLYLLAMTAEHYFPRLGFERVEDRHVPIDVAETDVFRGARDARTAVLARPLDV